MDKSHMFHVFIVGRLSSLGICHYPFICCKLFRKIFSSKITGPISTKHALNHREGIYFQNCIRWHWQSSNMAAATINRSGGVNIPLNLRMPHYPTELPEIW